MKNINKVLLIAPLLLSFACGTERERPARKNSSIVETTTEESRVEEFFNKSSVVCSESECPDNVAKLTFYNKEDNGEYKLGVCSGTLIKPGLMLTNSHCIPKNISYTGADCSKHIQVKFPGPYMNMITGTEMVKCTRVRSVYDYEGGEIDLALIEVERTRKSRSSVKFMVNEPNYGELVHAYTMDPSSAGTEGYIRKKECKLVEENNLYENEYAGKGSTFTLGSRYNFYNTCDIIGGNSGSGLFTSTGELMGAIHAKIDSELFLDNHRELGFHVDPSFELNFIGLAGNIKCIGDLETHTRESCPIERVTAQNEDLTWKGFVEFLREKAGHLDTPEDELYVTIDENQNFGVARKASWASGTSFDREFINIPYAKFIEDVTASDTVTHKLNLTNSLNLL